MTTIYDASSIGHAGHAGERLATAQKFCNLISMQISQQGISTMTKRSWTILGCMALRMCCQDAVLLVALSSVPVAAVSMRRLPSARVSKLCAAHKPGLAKEAKPRRSLRGYAGGQLNASTSPVSELRHPGHDGRV